jgi:hypothetical protein
VVLGPHESPAERFVVRLRDGQSFDQVADAGRGIGTAFGVAGIRLTERPRRYLEIELLTVLPEEDSGSGDVPTRIIRAA